METHIFWLVLWRWNRIFSILDRHYQRWIPSEIWEDKWLENLPLREQYPCLYNIARHKQDTIAKVFSTSPLTKDNLAKCNWHGSKKCYFCHKNEILKHLFFECHFARAVWGCINIALGLPQPRSIPHMFGSWLQAFGRILKRLVLMGRQPFVGRFGYAEMI